MPRAAGGPRRRRHGESLMGIRAGPAARPAGCIPNDAQCTPEASAKRAGRGAPCLDREPRSVGGVVALIAGCASSQSLPQAPV